MEKLIKHPRRTACDWLAAPRPRDRPRRETLSFRWFSGARVMNNSFRSCRQLWLAGSIPVRAIALTNYTALYVFGHSRDACRGPAGQIPNGPMARLLSTNLGFPYQSQNNRAVGGRQLANPGAGPESMSAPAMPGALFVVGYHSDFFGLLRQQTTCLEQCRPSCRAQLVQRRRRCYPKGHGRWWHQPGRFNRFLRRAISGNLRSGKTIEANAAYKTARDRLAFDYPDLRLVPIDGFGFGEVLERTISTTVSPESTLAPQKIRS
jgi:hypothetical protein